MSHCPSVVHLLSALRSRIVNPRGQQTAWQSVLRHSSYVSEPAQLPHVNHLAHRADLQLLIRSLQFQLPNGHPEFNPGRPGERAAGGGSRPGARGPGRGPTVVWAQPGCWGFSSPNLQSEELVGLEIVTLLSPSQFAKAPYCALLSAQPRPAAGRATPWPGPPCDRPPQSASVEEVSRLA